MYIHNRNRFTCIENKLMVTKGEVGKEQFRSMGLIDTNN